MKKLISAALAAIISLSTAGAIATAEDAPVSIAINDVELVIAEGDTKPFIEDGRTLVPMRAIFEALGATVDWDAENRRVTAKDPAKNTTIVLTIDSNEMLVGNEKIELDVPAKIVNDRTVVPVRAIAESLGCNVTWDGDSRTVYIDNGGLTFPPVPCAMIEDLNEQIRINSPDRYIVANPTNPLITVRGYEYDPMDNMSQINCRWDVGEGADFIIRVVPGTVSGIMDTGKATEKEIFEVAEGVQAQIKADDDVTFAVWYNNDFSFGVMFTNTDWDVTDVLKEVAKDINAVIPVKGADAFYGFRTDSVSGRATLLILAGEKAGEYTAFITWGNGASTTVQWTMTCTYDEKTGTLVYDNGTKREYTDDENGNTIDTKELATGTKGTFTFKDGFVTWSDSEDKEQSESCQFVRGVIEYPYEEGAAPTAESKTTDAPKTEESPVEEEEATEEPPEEIPAE